MPCCNGWCPNLISRYRVSKRAYKMRLEVEKIKGERNFNGVGYHEPPKVVETVTSNTGYEAFESRMPTITGVLEALKDHNITRIGIHGMGGIGKTMLVKEVLKQAEKEKSFDKYLFLVVSNDPDLERIQREIAEQLGLQSVKETELARRDQLRERLKQENRVLIILDDIWKKLDLETLGIFFGDDQKGCKLLLTSRLESMDAAGRVPHRSPTRPDAGCGVRRGCPLFPVIVLSDNDAISLFEKIVGDLAGEFKSIMPQIVKECAGLPIAITTVANALKNRNHIDVWEYALNQLQMSRPIKIVGTDEKVYTSIELSYDFLPDEEKSLLLLCCLHGEDYDIMIEDLLKYAVGWDLLKDDHKIKCARSTVHKMVEGLKDSCLLLSVAISLPYINGALDLPNQFECSKLELLLLFYQRVDFRIPDSFFEGLKDLKVLKLSKSWSGVLPSSLSSLENLQTLCLDGEVQNAIIIGELKNLKALSLSLSDTEQLPKEIGQLTHLQLLDLGKCFRLKFIPPNVLSNLKRLEELYFPDDVEWEAEAQSTERINAMVSELDNLSHLTKLHICIKNAKEMNIEDCKIMSAIVAKEREEEIEVNSDDNIMFANLQSLRLRNLLKLKGFFSVVDSLVLFNGKVVFPNLEELEIEGMDSMKMIWPDQLILDSFCKLENLTVSNFTNLTNILPPNMLRTLQNLRVRSVGGVEKWEDGKLWEDGKVGG
ncbi:hypothetical protein SO802_012931 [Lithocarpus litseifolius]|uniref:AAA+ ATPase domain-containing protein n=1 Tax=Lithocarpus litseifolius TaxID=425828 RepID=A0AAW2D483_9ROSI